MSDAHKSDLSVTQSIKEADDGTEPIINDRMISNQRAAPNCQAFVLAPDQAPTLARYAEAKLPAAVMLLIDHAPLGERTTDLVALDNYKAGWRAGQMMAASLPRNGNVVVLRSVASVVVTEPRITGFIDATLQAGLNIVLDTSIGASVSEGRRNAYALLRDLSDQVDGVFTSSESSTLGVCIALNHLGLAQQVIHVGIDVSFVIRKALNHSVMLEF